MIAIERAIEGWTLTAKQFFPFAPEELFDFFGSAENLETITPPWVNFRIVTPTPISMHVGTLIDYRLKIHRIPILWRTEITEWSPPFKFVDQQLNGPYKKWIHSHTFTEQDGGTLMVDHVEYDVPMGAMIHQLFVRNDLNRIFSYRKKVLEQIFNGSPGKTN